MSDQVQGSGTPTSTPSSEPSQELNSQTQELSQESGDSSVDSGVVADLQEQAVNGTPAQKAEAKKMLKSLKIKFNGREYEETLPFEIPDDEESKEYMARQLQMSKLAQSKAQEYSQLEKEVRAFVEELRKNPKKALSNPTIGIDVKKLAAEIIEEEIENSQKSPEQLEKEKLEAELKALKEEREREKEERQQKELERLQEQEYERYDMLMSQALETSKLPKTPYVIKKMADYMLLGLQEGIDVTPQDVLPLVEQEMQNDLKEMFGVMPDEVIESIVGKDVINRIRKKNVAKVKANGQVPPTPIKNQLKDVQSEPEKKDSQKKISMKNFFGI
jgi:hypothetical protein